MDHSAAVHTSEMLRWIPLLPLFGAVINFLAGASLQKRFGRGAVAAIACLMPILSFVLVVQSFQALRALPSD